MLEARVRLARVGMENVTGYLEDGMTAWFREGLPVEQVPQITVQDLCAPRDRSRAGDRRPPARRMGADAHRASPLKPLPKLTTCSRASTASAPLRCTASPAIAAPSPPACCAAKASRRS